MKFRDVLLGVFIASTIVLAGVCIHQNHVIQIQRHLIIQFYNYVVNYCSNVH